MTRAKWLRAAAGHHTRLANILINVARYMESKTGDAQRAVEIKRLCLKTVAAYKELAGKLSKQENLTQSKKDQIKESWMAKGSKHKGKEKRNVAQEELNVNIKIEEVQKL